MLFPQLQSYLSSNDIPPDDLILQIQEDKGRLQFHIDSATTKLARLDDQIMDIRCLAEALEKKMEALKHVRIGIIAGRERAQLQKSQYEAITSSIRRFPVEVIGLIFSFSIFDQEGYTAQFERLVFGSYRGVSRLWRAAAYCTPSLWRAVRLERRFQRFELEGWDTSRYSQALKSWFLRAGPSARLHLSVAKAARFYSSDAFSFIHTTNLNVCSLSLEEAEYDPARYATLFSDTTVYPSITHLELNMAEPPGDSFGEVLHLVDINAALPGLMELQVCCARTTFLPTVFLHASLKSLELGSLIYTREQLTNILRLLPSLEEIILTACKVRDGPGEVERYTHPTLEHLYLNRCMPSEWFTHLSFPQLKLISVSRDLDSLHEEYTYRNGQILGDFVQRSAPADLRLSVEPYSSNSATFLHGFLQNCTSVHRLFLAEMRLLDPQPQLLTNRGRVRDFLTTPQLFQIPSSLQAVVYWRWVDVTGVRTWVQDLRRYLRPGQTLEVHAPYCERGGRWFRLAHHIPKIPDDREWFRVKHSFKHQCAHLFEIRKFVWAMELKKWAKQGLRTRPTRVKNARVALYAKRHFGNLFQKGDKSKWRRARPQASMQSSEY